MQWQYLCEQKTRFGQRIPRKRGHVVIDDGDGHEYHYDMKHLRHRLREFKQWAKQVFCNYGEHKLAGKWPYYHVERRP